MTREERRILHLEQLLGFSWLFVLLAGFLVALWMVMK